MTVKLLMSKEGDISGMVFRCVLFTHNSPLVAYHKETDMILMLDTARYKYPPRWIKTADLYKAMNTADYFTGNTRGVAFGRELQGLYS
jgi:hypothetical protein